MPCNFKTKKNESKHFTYVISTEDYYYYLLFNKEKFLVK